MAQVTAREAMRKEASFIKDVTSGATFSQVSWSPRDPKRYLVRLLPQPNTVKFWERVYNHYNLPGTKQISMLCPASTFTNPLKERIEEAVEPQKSEYLEELEGLSCPICDKINELLDSDSFEDKQLAGKMSPKARWIANCLVLSEDDQPEKVRIWTTIPLTVFQEIQDIYLMEDEDKTLTYGEIQDYKEGRVLIVKREGTGQFDTSYNIQAHPKLYPVSQDRYSKEVYDLLEYARSVLSQPIEMLADAVSIESTSSESMEKPSALTVLEKEIEQTKEMKQTEETEMIDELSDVSKKDDDDEEEEGEDVSLDKLKALLAEVDQE